MQTYVRYSATIKRRRMICVNGMCRVLQRLAVNRGQDPGYGLCLNFSQLVWNLLIPLGSHTRRPRGSICLPHAEMTSMLYYTWFFSKHGFLNSTEVLVLAQCPLPPELVLQRCSWIIWGLCTFKLKPECYIKQQILVNFEILQNLISCEVEPVAWGQFLCRSYLYWQSGTPSTDNLVQDTWDRGHFCKTSENQSGAYITVTQQDEDVTVLKGWPTRGPVPLLVVKCPFTGRGTGRFAHGSLREKCYSHTSRSAKGLTEVRLVRSTRTPARSRSGWDRGKGEESYVRWSRDRTYSFVDLLSDFVILSTQEATERSEPRHNMINLHFKCDEERLLGSEHTEGHGTEAGTA